MLVENLWLPSVVEICRIFGRLFKSVVSLDVLRRMMVNVNMIANTGSWCDIPLFSKHIEG